MASGDPNWTLGQPGDCSIEISGRHCKTATHGNLAADEKQCTAIIRHGEIANEARVIKTNAAAAEIEPLIARLEQSDSADPEILSAVAAKIAHAFGVADDEVAVLGVISKGKLLKFIIPEKLRTIGTIPLSSTGALAAKTAREKRGEVSNNFASSRHASVFEAVPIGRAQGETIQKIMSAPILLEGKTIGVVQISRKARSQEESGTDFRSDDLRKLQITGRRCW